MNNIEELKAAATAMRLSSTMRITDEIITFRRLFTPDCALALIAQLEAAQKVLKNLEGKVNHYVSAEYARKHFDQTPDIIKRADSAELELAEVKSELSAANEKLSKPVVLLDKYVRNEKGQYILDGKCEPRIGFAVGWNAAIKAAGFTVEG
ncbi:TPA: hypothetical protein ACPZAW_000693 [Yersinia enterocolitica]|nr:hypothetical protein [Yersinia enterocolitica]EKN5986896.1 hypothetical protein [Yersinia enterocolitica]ELX2240506.1 hypothetical protein [Yersinia enterocolitica]HDX5738018.1 hypothetical protein [Yersinia enterocolitica]